MLAGMALASPNAHAQPANDDFSSAAVIATASGSLAAVNTLATKEGGEPFHAGDAGGASIWYVFTSAADGQITFDTFGSDFDTLLGVYTGLAVNSLANVASNDDDSGTTQSRVVFLATAGTPYYIAVDGKAGATGNFALNWATCPLPPAAPANPSPMNFETTDVQVTLLDWDDSLSATQYDVFYDGADLGLTATSDFTLSAPASFGYHNWQVYALDGCSTTPSPAWLFKVCPPPPGLPTNPSPPNGGATTDSLSLLDWDDVPNADMYNVHFDGMLVGTVNTSQFALTPPLALGTHTWEVDPLNDCALTPGPVWMFEVCNTPGTPANPSPAVNETTGCGLTKFDWDDTSDTVSYDVYLDGSFIGSSGFSDFDVTGHLVGGDHNWQVVSNSSCSSTTGPLWTFCLLGDPGLPTPADGETTGCNLSRLSWAPTCPASLYDIYIDGAFTTTTVTPYYDLPGPLPEPSPHEWRVVARSSCGTTVEGTTWTFCLLDTPTGPVSPTNGQTDVSVSFLDWNDTCGADFYVIYVDGVSIGAASASISSVVPIVTTPGLHTWQVYAVDYCTSTAGPEWTFNICSIPDVPANPYPQVGETTACDLLSFDWDDTPGATTYTVYLDGAVAGSSSSSDFPVGGLLGSGSTHTWQVVANSLCDSTTGPLWNFCLAGGVTAPSPFDGETTACGLTRLDWDSSCTAQSYDVYLDSVLLTTTVNTEYDLSAPVSGPSPHSWYVVANSVCGGAVGGTTWTFCLLDAPSSPTPANGANAPSVLLLDWADTCGADSYEVFLDGVSQGTTLTSELQLTTAPAAGTHTWQVYAVDTCSSMPGPIWTFSNCQPPDLPSNPSPFSGETTSPLLSALDWNDAARAISYDIYLDGSFAGNSLTSDYTLTSPLAVGLHSWQVVANASCGSVTTGPVWIFKICTTPAIPSSPNPANGETTYSSISVLDWADSPGADDYAVYLDGSLAGTVTSSEYVLTSPLALGSHTWMIEAGNPCTTVTGPLWTFQVCGAVPGMPSPVFPKPGTTIPPKIPVFFDWTDTSDTLQYNLYVDGILTATLTESEATLFAPLSPGSHSYQVVAVGGCVDTTSPLWTFCVLQEPILLTPSLNSILCSNEITFSWLPSPSALSYSIFIDSIFIVNTTATSWSAPAPIADGPHAWTVVANSACGSIASFAPFYFVLIEGSLANNQAAFTNGVVYAMATSGTTVYIGGNFTRCGTPATGMQTRINLAAIDLVTGLPTAWNPGCNGIVRALAIQDNTVYVGGAFTSCAGSARNNIAAIDPDVGFASAWNPGANNTVLAITTNGSDVFVGGSFTILAGQPRTHLGKVSAVSGFPGSWNADADRDVYCLHIHDFTLYAGGIFTKLGGIPRGAIGAMDFNGVVSPWNPNADLYVYSISSYFDKVYAGGLFNNIGGATRHNLAELDNTTGTATTWNPDVNGAVNAVVATNPAVYIGGFFSAVGGLGHPYLSLIDRLSGGPADCNFMPDNVVRAIAPVPPSFCIGGDFTVVGPNGTRGWALFGLTTGSSGTVTLATDWELYP